jgi:conjugal transfer mating pair stabilization protein TraN
MNRIFHFCWVLLFYSIAVTANNTDFEEAINKAKVIAQNKKGEAYNQAQRFNPNTVFDYYTKNPSQTKYYEDETQSNTQQMTKDSVQEKHSETGKNISHSINEHPQFIIRPSDPDMQHAKLLQNEAYNIVHGITSQYVDCQPKKACTTQYENKQCEEIPQALFQSCKKKLIVDVIPHENVTRYPLEVSLSVKEHDYAGLNINVVDGTIEFIGPREARYKLDGRLPGNIDCHTLFGSVTASEGNGHLDYLNYPSCSNNLVLSFHFSNGHSKKLKIDMASKVMTYEIKDHWEDDCSAISQENTCKLQSQQCDIQKSTQVIQGVPVTRDCWQESFNYVCRLGNGQGNCDTLYKNGCEQIGSQCKEKKNEQCTLYQQTYRCPIQACSITTDIICGNGQEYCLDGNCTDHSYQPSQDFAKSASALAAGDEAGKFLDQSSVTIFSGHATECSEKPVGFSDCCTETGWGQDTGLDHCPDAAKKLHVDRENKLAIKAGRYCSGPEPFPCIEHNQVFCVFSSKLAKIIQEQGRGNQLHISFGRGDEPNCRGITPEELQKIDFSQIDFQDFMVDLNNKIKNPNVEEIKARIKREIEEKTKRIGK